MKNARLPELPPLPPLDGWRAGETVRMDRAHEMMRAYALAYGEAVREECAKAAEHLRATRMESASKNNGRASDFAFGYVNAADEIAAAIRDKS